MNIAEKISMAKHGLEAIANCPLDEDWGDEDPAQWMVECAKEHLSIIEHGWTQHWELGEQDDE